MTEEEANKNERIKKLSEEIKQRQEELHNITMSDAEKAYVNYEAAVENCQELFRKYEDAFRDAIYRETGMFGIPLDPPKLNFKKSFLLYPPLTNW